MCISPLRIANGIIILLDFIKLNHPLKSGKILLRDVAAELIYTDQFVPTDPLSRRHGIL